MPIDPHPVAPPAPVSTGTLAETTIDPADGGENVHLVGGTVSTAAATTTTDNALADVTATTTPTAFLSLAAGPRGIIVQSDDGNDPLSVIRVASNADATHGISLRAGQSYTFDSIANASNLSYCLQAAVSGAAVLHVMQD